MHVVFPFYPLYTHYTDHIPLICPLYTNYLVYPLYLHSFSHTPSAEKFRQVQLPDLQRTVGGWRRTGAPRSARYSNSLQRSAAAPEISGKKNCSKLGQELWNAVDSGKSWGSHMKQKLMALLLLNRAKTHVLMVHSQTAPNLKESGSQTLNGN